MDCCEEGSGSDFDGLTVDCCEGSGLDFDGLTVDCCEEGSGSDFDGLTVDCSEEGSGLDFDGITATLVTNTFAGGAWKVGDFGWVTAVVVVESSV